MIKDTLEIPETSKELNVSMIPKPEKWAQGNLKNQRGIFVINILKSIVMKILRKDNYDTLDSYMSDYNIALEEGRGDKSETIYS